MTPMLLIMVKFVTTFSLNKSSGAAKKKAKKAGGGKKGKKGKKGAAAAASSAPEEPSVGSAQLNAALKDVTKAFAGIVSKLRVSLRSLSDGHGLPAVDFGGLPLSIGLTPEETESKKLELSRELREAQAQTCDRLLACVRDKLVVLQDTGML
uniref:Uncharacterized protein n=1 Tax=Phaeomonas parva TaxID=124430 RepID=A0A7S1UHR4_9STRA